MSTRLDRLVILLETGSTPVVRNTAATQIADVVKVHSHELYSLLWRVMPLLRSRSWETRTAASKTIAGIAENVKKFEYALHENGNTVKIENAKIEESQESQGQMRLATLDILGIMRSGTKLVGSIGKEFNNADDFSDPAALARQKKMLKRKLDLDFVDDVDDDILVSTNDVKSEINNAKKEIPEPDPQQSLLDNSNLSARQRNQLKRKLKTDARIATKLRVLDNKTTLSPSSRTTPSNIESRESSMDIRDIVPQADGDKVVVEPKPQLSESSNNPLDRGPNVWPFEALCEILLVDIFDPFWEARHGSAMALRDIFRVHGGECGRRIGLSQEANDLAWRNWCEDAICRILCVLTADRFGDYVSDQVVAPVRENASQAMAALVTHVPPDIVEIVCRQLIDLVLQEDLAQESQVWEARHAGMIGLKYVVAVRPDVIFGNSDLLDAIYDTVIYGLGNLDDDVRAVSAAILLPVLARFIVARPQKIDNLVRTVWESLGHLRDELSASTGSVMDLLSQLCSFPDILKSMASRAHTDPEQSFAALVPRLYPFLRHTISSVRMSAIKAISKFLSVEHGTNEWVDAKLLQLVFQNILLERNSDIRIASFAVWDALTIAVDSCAKLTSFGLLFASQAFNLALTPLGAPGKSWPLDVSLLIRPSGTQMTLSFAPSGKSNTVEPGKVRKRTNAAQPDAQVKVEDPGPINIDTPILLGDVTLVGYETLISSRIMAASALGKLVARWLPERTFTDFQGILMTSLDSSNAWQQIFGATILESAALTAETNINKPFSEKLQQILKAPESPSDIQDVRVHAAFAGALIAIGYLPKKLNPVIQSEMTSLKIETDPTLREKSAKALDRLITLCVSEGRDAVVNKLITNVCKYLCVDTTDTPDFALNGTLKTEIYSFHLSNALQEMKEANAEALKNLRTQRFGAQQALSSFCESFGDEIFTKLPKLKSCMRTNLELIAQDQGHLVIDDSICQQVIDELTVARTLASRLSRALLPDVLDIMKLAYNVLYSELSVMRYSAARTIASICKETPSRAMAEVIGNVLPCLSDQLNITARRGAIECIMHITKSMGVEIVPFVIFLIIPTMGRMNDSDKVVRLAATETFAELVKLVPLDGGIDDPADFPEDLLEGREKERKFLAQMLDVSKIEYFQIPVAIKADLRRYQQDGVNWLAFLRKYQLHGVLCDDMGLGKTLQTICIIASDHHDRQVAFEKTNSLDMRKLPSLVICPPSVTGHWQQELSNYAPFLNIVAYVGNPSERAKTRPRLTECDVVVTSYDITRNDVELLSSLDWNYCVLDEGHIIKSAKTKHSIACKRLRANHRLILSGTPIQNNVLELWSLFDFLMPGFLGSEKEFYERYAKPIASSRDSKSSSTEQEAGALALEALHKQILPFLLRRLKEDVLADLPPKIIQDYYCELSPLQKKLYEEFASSQGQTVVEDLAEKSKGSKQHVFQALQYMRKLCNHPALVMEPKHPKYEEVMAQLKRDNSNIRDVIHAPKLMTLRELLLDCGIGAEQDGDNGSLQVGGVVSQHRALIFCQLKDMLDMVENDVLKKYLPSVTYLRLDGNIEARKRQDIVQKFNNDASIDLLLLTTHVGGLGLNLTGADTVIFVEHDWNPMKDLQAMDRAHRIGQKKVVNVYRLITKGTLEEKIMGLQKFKMNIASSVVNQQNSGLSTMNTDQIFDLFNVNDAETKSKVLNVDNEDREDGLDETGEIKKGGKNILADVEEIWDENQYQEEYNLTGFLDSLPH